MKSIKRVVLMSPVPPPVGGMASWTEKYNSYMNKKGIDLSIVDISIKGERINKINGKINIVDEIKRTVHIILDLKKVLQKKADILHINSSLSYFGIVRDFVCVLIGKIKHVPILFQCHCSVDNTIDKNAVSRYLLKKIYKMTDLLVVLNQRSKDYLKSLGIDSVIIPNFIDDNCINSSHDISHSIKNILYVGHIRKEKGCMEILDVARKRTNQKFFLVGPIGKEFENINHTPNVFFVGIKTPNEIKELLDKADVFLFPSYSEGFSLALLEAIAAGVPCIATNVGANNDMLKDGGGVIVKLHSSFEIIRALEEIAPFKIREKMSKINIEKARKCYSISIVMDRFIVIYERIVRKNRK